MSFAIGDGVKCIAKDSLFKDREGIIMDVNSNHAPFKGPAVEVCFVMQGTVWVRPERLEKLSADKAKKLTEKQNQFIAKRRQRGLY
jgi:hypothetical protein